MGNQTIREVLEGYKNYILDIYGIELMNNGESFTADQALASIKQVLKEKIESLKEGNYINSYDGQKAIDDILRIIEEA